MPWPLDDLVLTDLAASSGNLARARTQIYGVQTKIKETLAANPSVIGDNLYRVLVQYNNKNATILDRSPNASGFSAGAYSPPPGTNGDGYFAVTHNLGVGHFNMAVFASLQTANPVYTSKYHVEAQLWDEADEGVKTGFRYMQVLSYSTLGSNAPANIYIEFIVL